MLSQAAALGCDSVAIPAIGCGVQGWRPAAAARAALEAIAEHNATTHAGTPTRIDFVLRANDAWRGFRPVAEKILGAPVAESGAEPEPGVHGGDTIAEWELGVGARARA